MFIVDKTYLQCGKNADLNFIDTSLITNMEALFMGIDFYGNISQWNTSNVITMENMFKDSAFNQDISKWNMSKVENMQGMFLNSEFNGDVSSWERKQETGMFISNSENKTNTYSFFEYQNECVYRRLKERYNSVIQKPKINAL